jgi:hypothetical protein
MKQSSVKWEYCIRGIAAGPVTAAELRRLAEAQVLTPGDLVKKLGMDNWVAAGKVKRLFFSSNAAKRGNELDVEPAAEDSIAIPSTESRLDNGRVPAGLPSSGSELPAMRNAINWWTPRSLFIAAIGVAAVAYLGKELTSYFRIREFERKVSRALSDIQGQPRETLVFDQSGTPSKPSAVLRGAQEGRDFAQVLAIADCFRHAQMEMIAPGFGEDAFAIIYNSIDNCDTSAVQAKKNGDQETIQNRAAFHCAAWISLNASESQFESMCLRDAVRNINMSKHGLFFEKYRKFKRKWAEIERKTFVNTIALL